MMICSSETYSFDKGRTKRLNESPTLSVGTPKKPMEDPRTLVYKTLGKSLYKQGEGEKLSHKILFFQELFEPHRRPPTKYSR